MSTKQRFKLVVMEHQRMIFPNGLAVRIERLTVGEGNSDGFVFKPEDVGRPDVNQIRDGVGVGRARQGQSGIDGSGDVHDGRVGREDGVTDFFGFVNLERPLRVIDQNLLFGCGHRFVEFLRTHLKRIDGFTRIASVVMVFGSGLLVAVQTGLQASAKVCVRLHKAATQTGIGDLNGGNAVAVKAGDGQDDAKESCANGGHILNVWLGQ